MTEKPLIPENALTFEEASAIWQKLTNALDLRDEDQAEFFMEMKTKAVRYAHIRAGWSLLTKEEKQEKDSARTAAHDSFITAMRILSRLTAETGTDWPDLLNLSDRKRVGDFACYLAMSLGLKSR